MNAETLRSSILQKAMEGKLLPQLSEEVDVDQIGDTPDEIPFEIPNKWKWIQIKNLVTKASQKIPDKKFEYVDVSSIDSEHLVIANTKKIDAKEAPSRARKILFPGMVIYSTVRPYLLKTCVIGKEFRNRELIGSTAFASMTCKDSLLFNKYFLYCLSSPFFVSHVKGIQKGVAYPAVSEKDFFSSFVPIPPVGEQKRIVKKLEELLPLVEEYGRDQEQLEKINKDFPVQMEKSLLREAVSGKLVPQLDEELEVEQIGDAPEEVPFDIPCKWKWIRLNSLTDYIQRGKSPKYSEVKKIPVVSQKCNQWSGFEIDKARFIDPDTISKYSEERKLQDLDLLWNSTGTGTIGRVAVYESKLNPFDTAVADSHVTVVRVDKELMLPKFLYWFLRSPFVQRSIESLADGSTNQKELATRTIKNVLVPVPPLEEQKRIVEKLDKLMLEIKKLK